MNFLFLAGSYVALDFLPQVNEVDKHNCRLTRLKLEIKDYIVVTLLLFWLREAYVCVACMCHMFTSVGVKVYVYMHVYIYAEVRWPSGINCFPPKLLRQSSSLSLACCFSSLTSQLGLGIPCLYLCS